MVTNWMKKIKILGKIENDETVISERIQKRDPFANGETPNLHVSLFLSFLFLFLKE